MDERERSETTKAYLLSLLSGGEYNEIEWLQQQKENIEEDLSGRKLFLAFNQASRYFEKKLNRLNKGDLVEVDKISPGIRPDTWNQLQTARIYLLLHFKGNNAEHYIQTVDRLVESADMHEQEAVYAALPLLPYQENLKLRAAEGLRTNITSVFDSIALNNPYPAKYLDDQAWNQMVIKSFFLQRPIYQIVYAESRANQSHPPMFINNAHDGWAAAVKDMPQLWRIDGAFLSTNHL